MERIYGIPVSDVATLEKNGTNMKLLAERGVRSDTADLYRQQDLNVTLEHDYWGSSG